MISGHSLLNGDNSNSTDTQRDENRSKRLAVLLFEVARSLNHDLPVALPRIEGDPRLEALRTLILEDERTAIARLQERFDNSEQLAEAVSSVLANAVSLAGSRDEQLATVLAPTLERATQASIRKNPGTMVDILYPLMGPAIRKSIAESLDGTLQRLNQAFKHSFSWRGLKWRLEAFRTGTSFADVVLKHTVEFRVEHVFLIHRKTGLLLEHVAAPEATAQDPQLVSGMLTAIQDFVRDSFEGSRKDSGGIDTLRLGDMLLWSEEGPFAFLAAVIRGNPPESLHSVMRETLSQIHEQFRNALEDFQGDSSTLGDLTVPLNVCLQQREQPREAQLSPWLWAIPLVVVLFVGGWLILREVERFRVDAYVQRLRDEPGVVVTGAERRSGRWQVSGLRDPLAADPAAMLAESGLDDKRVVGHWDSYQALDPAIVLRRISVSLSLPPGVLLSLDGNTIKATGNAPQHWVEQVRALIASLPAGSPRVDFTGLTDIQDPTFVRLRDAVQGHVITFDSNAPRPSRGQDAVLDGIAEEFRQLMSVANGLGFSVRVMISGHADSTGNETSNLSLSAARAEVVRSMLRARGIAPDLLTVRSAGPLEPLQSNEARINSAMNRRVTFNVSTTE